MENLSEPEHNKSGHDDQSLDRRQFYKNAADYWSQVPATIDGMLGGFGFISNTDIQGSQSFIKQLFKMHFPPCKGRAVDCGAGIGRITKHLLLQHFSKVDLVEQDPKFIDEAKNYIGPSKKIGHFINKGLQDFEPEPHTYDVIWCQWVLGHLTDEDFVKFFTACLRGLKLNGVIVVKENVTSGKKVEVDEDDSSVTRPVSLLQTLFRKAGLECIRETRQEHFPRGLYIVKMFALRPALSKEGTENQNTSTS